MHVNKKENTYISNFKMSNLRLCFNINILSPADDLEIKSEILKYICILVLVYLHIGHQTRYIYSGYVLHCFFNENPTGKAFKSYNYGKQPNNVQ